MTEGWMVFLHGNDEEQERGERGSVFSFHYSSQNAGDEKAWIAKLLGHDFYKHWIGKRLTAGSQHLASLGMFFLQRDDAILSRHTTFKGLAKQLKKMVRNDEIGNGELNVCFRTKSDRRRLTAVERNLLDKQLGIAAYGREIGNRIDNSRDYLLAG